jgi:hypothetical protein
VCDLEQADIATWASGVRENESVVGIQCTLHDYVLILICEVGR